MTRSQKLLLTLAPHFRTEQFDVARDEIAKIITTDEEWRDLTHEAGRNRLLGYVAHAAEKDPRLPPLAQDEAWRILDGMRVRFAYHSAHLEDMVGLLRTIPFCLLKGYAIARGAHGISFLRPCGDIDLLISPAHLLDALERFVAAGFTFSKETHFPWPPPRWLRKGNYPIEIDEIVLHKDNLVVEIHLQLASFKLPHTIDLDELLTASNSIMLPTTESTIPTLSPEDTWLHLAINHSIHRFSGGLGPLLDLAKWEDRQSVDVDHIESKLVRWKIGYLVRPVLSQLKFLFPDLPSVRTLAHDLPSNSDLLRQSARDQTSSRTLWYWMQHSPSPLRTLWRNVFPSAPTAALRYGTSPNNPFLWGHRLSRPFTLLFRHGTAITREMWRR